MHVVECLMSNKIISNNIVDKIEETAKNPIK